MIYMWIYYCLLTNPACTEAEWYNTHAGPVHERLDYKSEEACLADRTRQANLFIANNPQYFVVGNQCKQGAPTW